jgi:hypothetical protein
MKALLKISFLTVLTISLNSCQKENIPAPELCTTHQETGSGQRISGSSDGDNSVLPSLKVGRDSTDDIVGGGDDDRDGGRLINPKKSK